MKKVCGIGINDVDYIVQIKEESGYIGGKRKRRVVWICPYYQRWANLIRRCYSEKEQIRKPAYIGCSVCTEWLTFSKFKAWMEKQDWEGKELDKDLLVPLNRVYSPETCVFVSSAVNTFMLDCKSARGKWPVGVYWDKENEKFKAQCSNPFTSKNENLGRFNSSIEAHQVWLARKLELAKLLAAEQDDPRVAKALVERYENYICD